MTDIRVRFAPSPTGTLHIGGARTALFNWLFAKSIGGVFVLRLEDTDLLRSTEDSAQGILEGLKWLGLEWDEGPGKGGNYGPYQQSKRLHIYNEYLEKLLAENKAYYCFCSPDELKIERDNAMQAKRDYKYSGKCKCLSDSKKAELLSAGKPAVIRIKAPDEGKLIVQDLIRGNVEFSNSLLDDFIIAKSDGWPTYNFAVAVDDYCMKISHVIRAEEHLSNTPKQMIVYNALGFPLPLFAHVSMILAPDRSKLSKRHGATSVQEFRDLGYLPEALLNYLALLGWSSGEDIDFWAIDDMIKQFKLAGVSRSPAIYDIGKLTWMNGHYLAEENTEKVMVLLENEAKIRGWLNDNNREYFVKVIRLVQNRCKTLLEFFNMADYFFEEVSSYDEKGAKKYFNHENSLKILNDLNEIIKDTGEFKADSIENDFRHRAETLNMKAGDLIHPTRLSLSGRTSTPGLFELMEVMGKEMCIKRINNAIDYVHKLNLSN
ncbi:MAG: glutamate--tRNA ligase [Syntrophomonadaceae bacterium]|nr:glutamate--tRNA ligase [Syntrophomonadaceae bacterium]